MTNDTTPAPPIPTTLTPEQAAAILGHNAVQTYADEHVVYAYAGRPCVCGDGHLFHADRFDKASGEMGIGVGRCANCDCDVFRSADTAMLAAALLVTDARELPAFTPTVLADIAAVRADLVPEFSWSQP